MPPKRNKKVNSGDVYNYLTVINEVDKISNSTGYKIRIVVCHCICGKYVETSLSNLLKGKPKSCGCKRIFNTPNPLYATTHGMSHTRIHSLWLAAKKRCNSNSPKIYPYYKGKGIVMCDEWKNDFMAFYKWSLENGYMDNLTLDRKENDKGYSPHNCRWIDRKGQSNNTTQNIVYFSNGIRVTLGEICDYFNLNYMTIYDRVRRKGISIQEAIRRGNQDFSKIKRK